MCYCIDALVAEDRNTEPDHSFYTRTSPNSCNNLICLKSYGNLILPSRSVVKIVQVTDKILRERLHQWHLLKKQSLQAVRSFRRPNHLRSRPWSSTPENDMFLTKTYVMTTLHSLSMPFPTSTLKIFVHRFGKVYSEKVVRVEKPSKRQKLNKSFLATIRTKFAAVKAVIRHFNLICKNHIEPLKDID